MHQIDIIPFDEQYFEGFRAVVGAVAKERKYLTFLDTPSIEMSRQFVDMMQKQRMPQLLAVAQSHQVIGWCDISPVNRPVFSHIGCLGMGIIDGYREQGIGERLITAALNAAQQKGLKRIELTVREQNIRAIRLYEKMGFVKEGFHKNAVLIDGEYFNHLSMALLWS